MFSAGHISGLLYALFFNIRLLFLTLASTRRTLYNSNRNFGKEVSMNTRTMLILYYIIINLIGLSAMVIDKIRAMERRFRIPESVLLIIALLGGSAGCIVGMIVFRHKKRKPAFRYGLPLILILQIGAWLALHIATSKIIYL